MTYLYLQPLSLPNNLLMRILIDMICMSVTEFGLARSAWAEKADEALDVLRNICESLRELTLCDYFVDRFCIMLYELG